MHDAHALPSMNPFGAHDYEEYFDGERGIMAIREKVKRHFSPRTEKTKLPKPIKEAQGGQKNSEPIVAPMAAIAYPQNFAENQRPVRRKMEKDMIAGVIKHTTKGCPNQKSCERFSERMGWHDGHSCAECPGAGKYKWRRGVGSTLEVHHETAQQRV